MESTQAPPMTRLCLDCRSMIATTILMQEGNRVGGVGSSVSLGTRTVNVHAHARGEDSPEKVLAANETLREQQQSGVTDVGPPSPRKRMSSRAPPSSPRVQRLEVREQKKASVKCASTLDFTALSVKRPPHTRAPAHRPLIFVLAPSGV